MAERRSGRRVGRPSTPVLNRDRIAEAALAIVTDRGLPKLTMKVLADSLGVTVAALYNHIASKADLLLLVQDAVMSRVDAAALGRLAADSAGMTAADRGVASDNLAAALTDWARSYRRVFAGYPDLVPLIATLPVSGAPATRRMYEVVAAGLVAVGIPQPHIVPVIVAFESFLFGSAMDAHAPATIFSSGPDESDAPVFSAAVDAFTARADTPSPVVSDDVLNPYADPPFEWGLAALVARTVSLLG